MAAVRRMTYSDAGVSLAAWNVAKAKIGKLVSRTYNDKVVGKFGHFGGMFDISELKNYEMPILVSSVDGVGTKLKIAVAMGKHDTVGEDLVNHCVNDILVLGAKPLFFLDYIGTGKLLPKVAEKIIEGFSRACKNVGCVLIGGETAEMPGVYGNNDYDLVGTIVGVVDEADVVDGSTIKTGDVLIGLRSNGLHTNGYSLARKIVTEAAGKKYTDVFKPTGRTFGEELLRTHRSYAPVLALMGDRLIKGCAHLTGGGFQENINRILPAKCNAVINTKAWTPDPIFTFLQKAGNVENDEIYRTLNMGIGMVLAVEESKAEEVLKRKEIAAFDPTIIGSVAKGTGIVKMKY
jgi:phosphoribosylformylglycinamidine cyclo-ligase